MIRDLAHHVHLPVYRVSFSIEVDVVTFLSRGAMQLGKLKGDGTGTLRVLLGLT